MFRSHHVFPLTPYPPELNAVYYLASPPPTLRSLLPPPSTLSFTNSPSLWFQIIFFKNFSCLVINGDHKVTNRDLAFFHVGFWTISYVACPPQNKRTTSFVPKKKVYKNKKCATYMLIGITARIQIRLY